ncbi:MAG: ADP-ribosylglycohydrolase family protein [Bacillota bacterium]
MLTRLELAANRALVQDRALGAMIGLAIGDSLGDAARTPENHQRYGITMDLDERASWSTDDTEFSLLTAKTLIDAGGSITRDDVVRSWRALVVGQDELPRGGASEIEAAENLRRGIYPPHSGEYNSHCLSDGAAMRATPIGIVCAGDPARAAGLAEVDASISHSRDGIWGAQAVAAAVATAMAGGTVDEVIDTGLSFVPKGSWLYHTLNLALEIASAAGSLENAWMPLHRNLWTSYKAVAPEAVSQAFALFKLSGGDFRRGVIYAGNFGRDADTLGAIVGALCGALVGASSIPERWIEKTRYPSGTCLRFTKGLDIVEIAAKLASLVSC